MKRVFIATPAWKGHFNPILGVAQWLRRMGAELRWLTVSGPPVDFQRLGFVGSSLPDRPPSGGPLGSPGWYTDHLSRKAHRVEPIREAIRSFRPDIVVIDFMYESVIAAHLEQVPYVSVGTSLVLVAPQTVECDYFSNMRRFAAGRQALFAQFGLSPEFWNFNVLSPWLNTVFTTREFIGNDAQVPPRTRLMGPSIAPEPRGDEPDFPWDRLRTDRPIVYASFGSAHWDQTDLFRMIAAAAAELDVQLVLSVGGLADSAEPRSLPGHPLVVSYAPQLELLRRVSVFITHGGANSVMESLYRGVPVLVVPISSEQPIQAYFVERSGAGLSLTRPAASVEAFRERLAALLGENAERTRALARIQASFEANDGARTVAAEVLSIG